MKNIIWWAIEIVLTIANLAVSFYISKIIVMISKIFQVKTEAGWTISQIVGYLGIFLVLEIFIHTLCEVGRSID